MAQFNTRPFAKRIPMPASARSNDDFQLGVGGNPLAKAAVGAGLVFYIALNFLEPRNAALLAASGAYYIYQGQTIALPRAGPLERPRMHGAHYKKHPYHPLAPKFSASDYTE